ncbi:MAG: DUF4956 domain-containing protein [Oscillospiraceae bacterium]|nr:DUF4956 domain-containing protein [Oscillospiraceae bacterium]
MLSSVTGTTTFTVTEFCLCTLFSLLLGAAIAAVYMFRNTYTKGFVITLALMPAIVQMVIMLVNGNLGTGVAVMGAFSLVRFRSVAGSAREISSIFLAMAVGLATGMGYLAIAVFFVLVLGAVNLFYMISRFGAPRSQEKRLVITIPETLDYTGLFDDLFHQYTLHYDLQQVKTTNMGSLYKLEYHVLFKNGINERGFLDELRCRNGNLEIICGKISFGKETL